MQYEKKIYLSARGLTKIFGLGRHKTVAVDHVDIDLYAGEVVSIVGESGSGKTTLAKMLLGLTNQTEGRFTSRGKSGDIRSQKRNRNTGRIFRQYFRIRSPHITFSIRSMLCFWIVFTCAAVESSRMRKKWS